MQTLPMEVNAIWSSGCTAASLLYLVNRYGVLSSLLVQVIATAPGSSSDTTYVYSALYNQWQLLKSSILPSCRALIDIGQGTYTIAAFAEGGVS